ncbi:MAG TPA: Crp/Fnr family transcriptional regulator [Gammaproteobacteria bacterium]|nr:Crp/Fnr family transcriptional regulator [Gammaproteobacteria bacterium]
MAVSLQTVQQPAFPELAAIPDIAWNEVLNRATTVRLPPGEVLARTGSACKAFLLVQKGTLRVRQISPEGREMLLYRLEPGELSILAITSLMGVGSCPADVVTESEVHALSIPHMDFHYAMEHSPGFRHFVLTILARRLSDTMRLVESVAFKPLDVRLAALLDQLFKRNDSHMIHITHEALAMELGTTREVVSRMLKDFEKKKGCVKLHRGRIELVQGCCLADCARNGFL